MVVTSPSTLVPLNVYPSGSPSSVHVYSISSPSLYTGKFSIVALHPFPSFNTTLFPSDNFTVIDSGLSPS